MDEKLIEEISGKFKRLVYTNNDYAVYRFEDKTDGNIIVTGKIEDIDFKSDYFLYGEYVNHAKYGFQFSVAYYKKALPNSLDAIVSYLSSDLFKGIGKKKAIKVVEHFKEDTLYILKKEPERIKEIDLNDKDRETIVSVLVNDALMEEDFYYFLNLGLSVREIHLIMAHYKHEARMAFETNPYVLYYDIYGIGFIKADELARKIEISKNDDRRLVALLTYIASDLSFKSGNTFHYYEDLLVHYKRMNEDIDYFDRALDLAIKEKKIYLIDNRYYHFQQFIAEKEIARFLNQLNSDERIDYDERELEEKIEELEDKLGIVYDDKQYAAINSFFKHRFSIITGGPGTGKTTIVKAMVETSKLIYPTYELHIVAPTGRAAKRISELCKVKSSTIHSLLKWDKDTNTFTYGIDNPLLIDILIIDEFSMVDNWLFYKLILALYNVKKICIIGDQNQLPSVGPGNLLHELIQSEMFDVTFLNTIFRQSKKSDIITLANDILSGDVNFSRYKDDVIFIDETNINIKEKLIEIIDDALANGYSLEEIQVLSPMYKGSLGIDVANTILQETYNPPSEIKREINTRFFTYRENDKILQLKNQSSDDVYNGDIGFIEMIDTKEKKVIASFDDNYVEYDREDLNNIALAYCVSVHKAQGSEYDLVFFLVSRSHLMMLKKKLIYTAVSRASHKLFILGNKDAFIKGISQVERLRKTSLIHFLKESIKM